MDGKVFKVSEQRVGVNFHPLHPWRRCSSSPVLPWDTLEGKRKWARNLETGEQEQIPADMTYAEWKQWQKEGRPEVTQWRETLDKSSLLRYNRGVEAGKSSVPPYSADIAAIDSHEVFKKRFEYTDEDGDDFSPVDDSMQQLTLEGERYVAAGIERARQAFGIEAKRMPRMVCKKLPAKTIGEQQGSEIRFSPRIAKDPKSAYETAIHEYTHWLDYSHGFWVGSKRVLVSERIFPQAVKNLGLRKNSSEVDRHLLGIVGGDGIRKGIHTSIPEVLAYSMEKVALGSSNPLARELIRLFKEAIK